jgi:hypothetical protein
MIPFFRKIRKKMANDNRPLMYMRYAVGEIVLVVIGILIALQINNWNENKNNAAQVNKHLVTLKLNLQDDIKQAEKLLTITDTALQFSNTFLDQFKTVKPVDKSVQMYLIFLMLEHNLEVNRSGVNAIINSNGMAFLNEGLQLKILNYYRHLEQLASREEITNSDIKLMYEPYVKENYSWIYNSTNPWPRQTEFYKNDPRQVEPIDEKSLLSDKKLEVMVFGRRFQSMRLRALYSNTITLAQEIIADIEDKD